MQHCWYHTQSALSVTPNDRWGDLHISRPCLLAPEALLPPIPPLLKCCAVQRRAGISLSSRPGTSETGTVGAHAKLRAKGGENVVWQFWAHMVMLQPACIERQASRPSSNAPAPALSVGCNHGSDATTACGAGARTASTPDCYPSRSPILAACFTNLFLPSF